MYQFVAKIATYDSDYQYSGIHVPNDAIQNFTIQKNRRINCTINDAFTFPAALLPDGNGNFFVTLNKQRIKTHKLKTGDEVRVTIEEDTSKYGMPLPEEMEELFLQDEEGSALFHQLTIGKQRSLIYMVYKIKSSQIRINKAIAILEYLKSTNGKFDFKELSTFLKNFSL
jgi:predicted RNA-binding protein (virulence factor B family)